MPRAPIQFFAFLTIMLLSCQTQKNNNVEKSVLFKSQIIKAANTVQIKANIKNNKQLVLIVEEGDDGSGMDQALWLYPKLSGPKGSMSLTKLKWKEATCSFPTRVGKNIWNQKVIKNGKHITDVISTHAYSRIVYDLPQGYDTFTATGAMMETSVKKNRGSVRFVVASDYHKEVTHIPSSQFKVSDDLEVTLWARSPMLFNPTNMDIDHEGRIWVAEGRNYRRSKKASNGDRIVVLEDKDLDGKADSSHVFVQSTELISPLGVAVVDNKVIVSQPPHLIVYTDNNRNAVFDEGDKKEYLLSGFDGRNHDHSLHSVTVHPNGSWLLNLGNKGGNVTDKSGRQFYFGSPYSNQKFAGKTSADGHVYIGGAAFTINPDGSSLRVLAHNFRNSYEQCASSFGDIFQNDNDDPPACRTTWLMEHANMGYASADGKRHWRLDQRPGQNIPTAHWRQEDPGVLPAGDIYGFGGPTGIVFYENGALGTKYEGMLLSCESVTREVFQYFPGNAGAGFNLKRNIFMGLPDGTPNAHWFRPSDISVGADGALYIADWFDPGVGGHATNDPDVRGAIYRIAPKGFKPHKPQIDLNTPEGMIKALKSPAVNVRALGFDKLVQLKEKVIHSVDKEMIQSNNRYFKARGIWVLAQCGSKGLDKVKEILKDTQDHQIAVTCFRALKEQKKSMLDICAQHLNTSHKALKREIALAMRDVPYQQSQKILMSLIESVNHNDPWMVEAIGIGCYGKEEQVFKELTKKSNNPLHWHPKLHTIAWRLHPPSSVKSFHIIAKEKSLSLKLRKNALTAIAFNKSQEAASLMLDIALKGPEDIRDLATWWIRNKHLGDWKLYNLIHKIKSNTAQKTLDFKKYLNTKGNKLPSLDTLMKIKGDPQNGKKLYFGKAICSSCHALESKGQNIGPSLTGIGKKHAPQVILDSMVNPSSAIVFGYENITVTTKQGTTYSGFLVADGDTVVIRDLAGNNHSVAAKDIQSKIKSKTSLMPSVKNLNLNAQEIMDIVSYLNQQK